MFWDGLGAWIKLRWKIGKYRRKIWQVWNFCNVLMILEQCHISILKKIKTISYPKSGYLFMFIIRLVSRSYTFKMKLRIRLVQCNGYYTIIRINITRNKRSCNVITITIHLFRDYTWIESWINILYFNITW